MSDISSQITGKIIIVGRPNVGKSSLHNRITSQRRALVSDYPGTTIDYIESEITINGKKFLIIDTGGWTPQNSTSHYEKSSACNLPAEIRDKMRLTVEKLLLEGARKKNIAIVFLVDAKEGLNPVDIEFSKYLRKNELDKYVLLTVNKTDTDKRELTAMSEFYKLGYGEEILCVSAQNGRNVNELIEKAAELILSHNTKKNISENHITQQQEEQIPRVMILGRPNAGKSTLINYLAGYERCIVNEKPGTTRESINTVITTPDGRKIEILDTPGIPRGRNFKNSTSAPLTYLSFVSVKKNLSPCDIAILLIDSTEGITKADESLAGMIYEEGIGTIVSFNKWDAIPSTVKENYFKKLLSEFKSRFNFLSYARFTLISSLTGWGITNKLLPAIFSTYESYNLRPDEKKISPIIKNAFLSKPLISPNGKRLIFNKILSTSSRPPALKIAVNEPSMVHFSYKRYLLNTIRENFPEFADGTGTPFFISFTKSKTE